MHVNAVQKVARSYEHIDPALVGNRRRVLVSDLAGTQQHRDEGAGTGLPASTNDTPELKTILARIKELEHEGYEFEAAEASLALLIRQSAEARGTARSRWTPTTSRCAATAPSSICEATVKVRVGGEAGHTVAEGDGPVNALDKALRAALVKFYPQLKKVRADRLQGAHPRLHHRHRRPDPRADRVHRRQGRVGHGRRERQYHRGQPAGLVDSMEYALMQK